MNLRRANGEERVTFWEGGKEGGKLAPLHLIYFLMVIHRQP